MARIKFRKLIDDYTKKGHRNPLRAAVEERVRSDYVIRNRRSRVDDSVDALLAIEKVEGETLKSVLKDDHVWSIVVDHYIPKELGYDSALSNEFMHDIKQKVDKIPPKFEDFYPPDQFSKEAIKTKFDEQFEEVFGKPPSKPPKKAAGGVVSLYNRPGYAIGGDIWEGIKGSKIGDVAKWGWNQAFGEEKEVPVDNRPFIFPQMTKEEFDDYSGVGFRNILLDMYHEKIPSSSVMDIRKGGHEGLEQIYPDINALMTNMPPTERDAAVVQSVGEQEWDPKMTSPSGDPYRYMFIQNVDGQPVQITPEDYLDLYQDPKTRESVWAEDLTGTENVFMGALPDDLEKLNAEFDNAYKLFSEGKMSSAEYDQKYSNKEYNKKYFELGEYQMMPKLASSVGVSDDEKWGDPSSPLYNYEMATQWAQEPEGKGYEKYPGSEGYFDRYYEDWVRLGINNAAQLGHFVVGDGLNAINRVVRTTGRIPPPDERPEWFLKELEKQGIDPDGWFARNFGTDPYNAYGFWDWMRTWDPNWAEGVGYGLDAASAGLGWLFNKPDWNPKFSEMLEDKDWKISNLANIDIGGFRPFSWMDDPAEGKKVSVSEAQAAEYGVMPGVYVASEEDSTKPDIDKMIAPALWDPGGGVQVYYDYLADKFGWEDRDMRDYQYKSPMDYTTYGLNPGAKYGDRTQPMVPGQTWKDWYGKEMGLTDKDFEDTGVAWGFPPAQFLGSDQVIPLAWLMKDLPKMLNVKGTIGSMIPRRNKKGRMNLDRINRDLERYLKYQKAGIKPPGRLKQLYETVTRAGTGRKTTDEFVDDLVKAIDVDAAATKKIEPPEKKKKKKKKKKPEEKKKSTIITHDPDYIGNAQGGMVDVRDMTGAL